MDIQQKDDGKTGNFKAIVDGLQAGIMTYFWSDENRIIIEHTVVAPLFEGKGIGKHLVMAAVNFAREKHIKIDPQCPYARSVFEKNKDIQDVLF